MGQLRRFLEDPDCVFAERLDDRYDWRKRYNNNISGVTIEKGPFGNNFVFDGLSYARSSVVPSLKFGTGDISIVFWFKTSTDFGSVAIMTHIEGELGANDEVRVEFNSDDTVRGVIRDNQDGTGVSISSSSQYNNGIWHLVSITIDRDSVTGMNLYIDGETDASPVDPTGENQSINAASLTLGASDSDSNKFTGSMRNILIFKRALTAIEVMNIYKGRSF